MAQFAYDGNVRIIFVPKANGITNIDAPSTAELGAVGNVDLSCLLPKDGWQPSVNSNSVEAGKLCQTFDASVPGTWGGEVNATFFRDSEPANDDAWNAFAYGDEGHIVVRYGLPHDTGWANGQPVEVWPVIAHQKQMQQTATNTNARFTLMFNVPSEPAIDAVVGGGS